MSKITLTHMVQSGDVSVINNNFDLIEEEFQKKVLYRDNPEGEPNTLETDQDANGKRIYNLPEPLSPSEAARLQDVQNAMAGGSANLVDFTPFGHISSTNVQAAIQEMDADLASDTGSELVGFKQDGTGAVLRTLEDKVKEVISVKDFGAVGDGVTDDTGAIYNWLNYLCSIGGIGVVPSGTYLMGSGVSIPLNTSVSIKVSSSAEFIAGLGFPASQRMFLFTTGTGTDHVFEWEGGRFNATNQPNSGVGESNDIFSFNAENCSRCVISLDYTTAGPDWLNSGSDTHLFVGGAKNVHAWIGRSVGAVDTGIYISSSADGTIGHSLFAGGNFEKCANGVIVKRQFEVWNMDVNAVDCQNGASAGPADNQLGVIVPPGDGCTIRVNVLRCERACSLQAVRGGIIEVQAKDIGVSIPGYTSTAAFAAYLSGSSNIIGQVTAQGVNPACTSNTSFNAVYCDRRLIEATNYDATDNHLTVNCLSIGKGIREQDANCARNHFILHERTPLTASFVSGTDSTLIRTNLSAGSYEVDASTVSLGGTRNAESLRVSKVANQVNFVNIGGGVAGSRPTISAAGTDTDVDLQISGKGAGLVRFGTFTSSSDVAITGSILIRDAAGNQRKIATIA